MYTTQILTIDRPNGELVTGVTGFTKLEHNPDLIWVSPLEAKTSIGIDQVHALWQQLALKPFSEKKKVVIISPAHALTLPAQQALLKLLEEPPEDTQILLATSLPGKLLPTILSRANMVKVAPQSTDTETPLYEALTTLKVSACLKQSDEWSKSRQEVINKLKALTIEVRERYLKEPTPKLLNDQKAIIICLEKLERNVNAKLALDHLLLSIASKDS